MATTRKKTTEAFWVVVPASDHGSTNTLPKTVTTTRYATEAEAVEAATHWARATGRVLYVAKACKRFERLDVAVTDLT